MKISQNPNPFAPIVLEKNFWFYLYWAVSILVLPVLFPIRIVVALGAILSFNVIQKLLTRNTDMSRPLSVLYRNVLQCNLRFCSRLLLWAIGIWHIEEKNKQRKPDFEKAYVAISNHCCGLDPIAHICVGFGSFVSKIELKTWPVFGLGVWSCQGLFVDRKNKKQSEQTAQQMN